MDKWAEFIDVGKLIINSPVLIAMKKTILLFTVALMMQSCSVTVEIPARNDNSLTSEQRSDIYWTSDTTSLIGLT